MSPAVPQRVEDGLLVGDAGERAAEEVARLLYRRSVAVFPLDLQRRLVTGQRPAARGFVLVPLRLRQDSRHPLGRWPPRWVWVSGTPLRCHLLRARKPRTAGADVFNWRRYRLGLKGIEM